MKTIHNVIIKIKDDYEAARTEFQYAVSEKFVSNVLNMGCKNFEEKIIYYEPVKMCMSIQLQ